MENKIILSKQKLEEIEKLLDSSVDSSSKELIMELLSDSDSYSMKRYHHASALKVVKEYIEDRFEYYQDKLDEYLLDNGIIYALEGKQSLNLEIIDLMYNQRLGVIKDELMDSQGHDIKTKRFEFKSQDDKDYLISTYNKLLKRFLNS